MDEQPNQQFNGYSHNSKRIWATIMLMFFTALIIGGGIYVWQQSNLDETKNILEQQISYLKNQVTTLQSEQKTKTLSTMIKTNTKSNNDCSCYNGRNQAVGTGCYENEANSYFKEGFNNEPANTFLKYHNEEKGIAFNIPYNNNWGSENCAVKPYVEIEEYSTIHFGDPWSWDGYSDFSLKFKTPQKAEEIIEREINECKGFNQVTGEEYVACHPNAKITTINNLPAATWDDSGMLPYKHIEVIGEKYNYLFSTVDGIEDELIEIIKTVELID